MSNAFTNFLGGVTSGVFGEQANLKDYQHANRLYVRDTYARAPKHGFLYFVSFNINSGDIVNSSWNNENSVTAAMLVKRLDLPKFQITTETLNQYNRKTVVQTSLKYQPISIDLHDDNSDITNNMWKTYFQYYYADSMYGNKAATGASNPVAFSDTKYGMRDFDYGFKTDKKNPFFKSIDIFVLHQHKFTQYTLVNPVITEWNHDSLDQSDGAKILSNRMSVAYETVLYNSGNISKNSTPSGFAAQYYDNTPSPLSIGGNGNNSLFGAGGVIDGADNILGSLADGNILGALIQGNTLVKNAKTISSAGLKQEGYSILAGALSNVQTTRAQSATAAPLTNILGNVSINLFGNKNSSVNKITIASPSDLTGKQ
jgi:hypothetical protein